jgi:hypothetical protein
MSIGRRRVAAPGRGDGRPVRDPRRRRGGRADPAPARGGTAAGRAWDNPRTARPPAAHAPLPTPRPR